MKFIKIIWKEIKRFLLSVIIGLFLICSINTSAQDIPGALPGFVATKDFNRPLGVSNFNTHAQTQVDSFMTTVYTFANITVFSYFDNTQIKIYNQSGSLIESKTLKADTLFNPTNVSMGIYKVVGNKTFTVLIGDAITNTVNGYYAVDESGKGVSTKLNTWMMSAFNYNPNQDEFAIFAYEDNTNFTVKNLTTGNIIRAGNLNKGKNYSFRLNGPIPYRTPLQVTANKGVSVLSYTDQDYYVPSSNGTFTGTLFYGYSAYEGYWTNSITVTSYANANKIVVLNSTTGDTISSYTLGKGQVNALPVTTPTYWTVKSTLPVSAANIPFAGYTGNYSYMTRAIDESGMGAGKLFYVPTISSSIDVFSFESDNNIKITELGSVTDYPYPSPVIVWQGTLNAGSNYNFQSPDGNIVYKIEGTKNCSVLQSYNRAGADFMPLSYALTLPDLVISTSDIGFSAPDSVYVSGDQISVSVKVHNTGTVDARNVQVYAYDGDPQLGGMAPVIANGVINNIAKGDSASWQFNYVIPSNPQYKNIVVIVDPNNLITESNKSNNIAKRFLRPNNDQLPPLSVYVTTPSNLSLVGGLPSPNPFTIKYDIFNTGTITATNVKLRLVLSNGLTLLSTLNDTTVNFGNLPANQTVSKSFLVRVNKDSSGFNLFSATVSGDNAASKVVSRAVNVPDGIPPAAPKNLDGEPGNFTCASLWWSANTEKDLAGFLVYYTTDSTNFNQNPPIVVYNNNAFSKCGFECTIQGVRYFFKIKAFDTSNNLSECSNQVSVLVISTKPTLLNGHVKDATTNQPVSGAKVSIAGLSTTTDQTGYYEFLNVPLSSFTAAFTASPVSGLSPLVVNFTDLTSENTFTLTVEKNGYITFVNSQIIISPGETKVVDASLSPVISDNRTRFVLNWFKNPLDLDSHLKIPLTVNSYYHLYYAARGDSSVSPFAVLDVDNRNGLGPETITITRFNNGVYYYYIHNFTDSRGGNSPFNKSNAFVQIYSNLGLLKTITCPSTGEGYYWHVCNVDGQTNAITVVNRIVADPPGPSLLSDKPKLIKSEINDIAKSTISKNEAKSPSNITSWFWDFGDNTSSTSQNPTHTYTSQTNKTYTVSLTVGNGTATSYVTKINYISTLVSGNASIKTVSPATVAPGTDFWVDIKVGDPNVVSNMFGISFILNYDKTLIKYVSAESGSWFGTDLLLFANNDVSTGTMYVGISRKSPLDGISGNGVVGRIKFSSLTSALDNSVASFSLSNAAYINPSGVSNPLNSCGSSTTISSGFTVWPGDINNDGNVSIMDVMPVGLNWSLTGPARPNASSNWSGQLCSPWSTPFVTYSDADGNGIINQGDLLPIGVNWGKTHTLLAKKAYADLLSSGSGLMIDNVSRNNNDINVSFKFDKKAEYFNSFAGISCQVDYSESLNEVDKISLNYGNYFNGQMINFSHSEKNTGIIDYGASMVQKTGENVVSNPVLNLSIKFKDFNSKRKFNIHDITLMTNNGTFYKLNDYELVLSLTDILDKSKLTAYSLSQNYPNPFNPTTTFNYSLPVDSYIKISICNSLGQIVKELAGGIKSAGVYELKFDAANLSSGIYFCSMAAKSLDGSKNFNTVNKLILIK